MSCYDVVIHSHEVALNPTASGYMAWREWCGLPTTDDFDELMDIEEKAVRDKFKDLYK